MIGEREAERQRGLIQRPDVACPSSRERSPKQSLHRDTQERRLQCVYLRAHRLKPPRLASAHPPRRRPAPAGAQGLAESSRRPSSLSRTQRTRRPRQPQAERHKSRQSETRGRQWEVDSRCQGRSQPVDGRVDARCQSPQPPRRTRRCRANAQTRTPCSDKPRAADLPPEAPSSSWYAKPRHDQPMQPTGSNLRTTTTRSENSSRRACSRLGPTRPLFLKTTHG